MSDRFCPSCGTEVDADARFCPTCGATLTLAEDEVTRDDVPVLPDAPLWPEPSTDEPAQAEPGEPATDAGAPHADDAAPADGPAAADDVPPPPADVDEDAPADEPRPPSPTEEPRAAAPEPAHAAGDPWPRRGDAYELPISWPTTLAGWLIGGGCALGALALIPRLNEMVSLLLFLALLGVAATIFLVERLPAVPHLRLLTLVIVMIGVGVAFDRAAFTVRGLETLLLVAMLAAAGGVLLIELDRDRPFPPPDSSA